MANVNRLGHICDTYVTMFTLTYVNSEFLETEKIAQRPEGQTIATEQQLPCKV